MAVLLEVARYCEPCLLFGHTIRKTITITIQWSDWTHISQAIKCHESVSISNDTDLNEELQFEISYRGKVLRRIIKVTLFLVFK